MDFEFSEEEKIFQKTIRLFAEKEIAPLVEEAEEKEKFPRVIFQKMGELGFLGMRYSEDYGGSCASFIAECICTEEVNRICAGIGQAIMVASGIGTLFIYKFGTEDQKQRWLMPTLKGKKIPAFALTEPNAGSDIKAIETIARKDGDSYILKGSKMFITNAPIADYITVAAYIDKLKGYEGIELFILDADTPGITIKKLRKLGNHSAETGEIHLDDCCISEKNLIKGGKTGFIKLMTCLDEGRILQAARSTGLAQAALEAGIKYAKERIQFGKPISKFQAIQFKLSDISMNVDIARLLTYRAASLYDKGRSIRKEAAIAKLFASEMVVRITTEVVHIFGGYGYMKEYPVERYLRDSQVLTVGEGTSEIQRQILAKEIGL